MERTSHLEERVYRRMKDFGFSEKDIQDYGLYDWEDWDEHYYWIMHASAEDIREWIDTIKCLGG